MNTPSPMLVMLLGIVMLAARRLLLKNTAATTISGLESPHPRGSFETNRITKEPRRDHLRGCFCFIGLTFITPNDRAVGRVPIGFPSARLTCCFTVDGEAGASIERIPTNTRHAVGDGDACETGASRERRTKMYIGQTEKCLKTRIIQHFNKSQSEFDKSHSLQDVTKIFVLNLPTELLDQVEIDCIASVPSQMLFNVFAGGGLTIMVTSDRYNPTQYLLSKKALASIISKIYEKE